MAELTAKKAGTMLKEGEARGKALTPKQKRFFGWVRGGRKSRVGEKMRKKYARR